ncbi:MAG: hypothetical protein WAN14_03360, partial [Candidatus Acidiferrales bacterium]
PSYTCRVATDPNHPEPPATFIGSLRAKRAARASGKRIANCMRSFLVLLTSFAESAETEPPIRAAT